MNILVRFSMVGLIWVSGAVALHGQAAQRVRDAIGLSADKGGKFKICPAQAYDQDAPEPALSTANMSAGVLDGYRLFRSKCGQCHSLNQSATKSEASVHDWTNMVFRMQDMPSSHMSETQSKAIVTFVVWQADYSNDLVKTLMAFDKDGDGKLSKSEVPERMQGMFDRADTNRDGMLTPEEIRKYAEAQDPSLAAASGNCGPDHQTKK